MKLSQWAKANGLSYKTAWRLWKAGKLPLHAEQLATGTVVIYEGGPAGAALYARVCSNDQKGDLQRQLQRLAEYAERLSLPIVDRVAEVGSGMNGHRRGLLRLLRNQSVQTIVVEHRDRLMRFGFEFVEAALASQNRKIVVIEAEELTDDIVRDLHEVIVSMCARLYGKRAASCRAKRALQVLHGE